MVRTANQNIHADYSYKNRIKWINLHKYNQKNRPGMLSVYFNYHKLNDTHEKNHSTHNCLIEWYGIGKACGK